MAALRHWLLLGLLLSASLCVMADEDDGGSASDSGSTEDSTPPPPPAKKKASAVISLASADYQLISAGGKRSKSGSAKLGSKLLDGVALEGGASLEVEFTPEVSGSPFRPQQAMLMVSPAEGGRGGAAAYAVGKPNRGGAHTATLTAGAVTKQLGAVGGAATVTLLLGDPSAAKGVLWELGTIELPPVAAADGGAATPTPAYRSARAQPKNNLLPNIAHTFRAPEKRPPVVVSLVFAAAALAPLAALFLWLAATGALSLPGFPSGAASMWALAFHGGIGALLLLYWLFWTRLDLATTLPLAMALGLGLAVAGYKALSAVADARLAAERASSGSQKKTQ